MDAVVVAFIPGVHVAAEGAGDVPFLELVQQEEGFLAGEGRCELEELGPEDVRVREHEGVAIHGGSVVIFPVQDPPVDQVDLRLPEGTAGGIQEDEVVEDDVITQVHDHVDLIEGRVEDIGPQGPSVPRDVVVSHNREERIDNLVVQERAGIGIGIVVTHIFVGVHLVVMLFQIYVMIQMYFKRLLKMIYRTNLIHSLMES